LRRPESLPEVPSAEASEEALLGVCFADAAVLEDVAHLVAAEDFSTPARGHVWEALQGLHGASKPVDHLTVAEVLRLKGHLVAAGGPVYLMRLDQSVPKPAGRYYPLSSNAVQYAHLVVDAARRRRAQALALATAASAADTSVSLESVLSRGAEAWQTLHASVPHLKEGRDLFLKVVDEVEAAGRGELTTCIATGIEPWDAAMAGLAFQELTFILSQPGVGKSTVIGAMIRNICLRAAVQAADNASDAALARPVDDLGIFSMEDAGTWLARRHLSQGSEIPLFVLQKGFERHPFTKDQMERFAHASGEVWNFSDHYVVDDRNMLTVDQVIQSAREMMRTRAKRGRRLRVFLLDHIGKMNHEIAKHGGKEDLAIEHTLNKLSQFAKAEDVAWAIAVHGKEREDGAKYLKPKLNSFARTAYFERDARVAVGLYLDKDDDSVLLATVLKQTNGPADVDFRMVRAKSSALVLNHDPDKHTRRWP